MTGTVRRVATILVALAVAASLIVLYRNHRREVAQEAAREAPVVAPSRTGNSEGAALVTLDSAEARGVGLQVAALRPASGRSEERLPAEVVPESERTAVLRAPVAGRFTVPSGARWPGLG